MPQMRFTDLAIRNLKPPKADKIDYYDAAKGSPAGFGIRVSTNGHKTWFLKYVVHGKQYRRSLRMRNGDTARYPAVPLAEARELATDWKSTIQHEGVSPAQLADDSLKGLAEAFVEEYAKPHKRSWRGDQLILLGGYFAPLHPRKAVEIGRGEIVERLQAIKRNNGPIMANRCLASIRKMYSWAIRNGKINLPYNPAMGIDRPSGETERDRVYSEQELRALWEVFGRIGTAGQVFKLCLVTGQRLNEVAGMDWNEVDGDHWTIPAARSKNKRSHVVALSGLAIEILGSMPRLSERFVFPAPRRLDQPIQYLSKTRYRVREFSNITDFRVHDLRRTCATGITKLGFPRFIADRVLNHIEAGVGRVYDRHDYLKEKTDALDAWARHLRGVIGEGGNVVQLRDLNA